MGCKVEGVGARYSISKAGNNLLSYKSLDISPMNSLATSSKEASVSGEDNWLSSTFALPLPLLSFCTSLCGGGP